jgi:hypothetical protein
MHRSRPKANGGAPRIWALFELVDGTSFDVLMSNDLLTIDPRGYEVLLRRGSSQPLLPMCILRRAVKEIVVLCTVNMYDPRIGGSHGKKKSVGIS